MATTQTKRHNDDAAKWYVMAQLAQAVTEAAEAEARVEVARKVRDDAIRRAKALGLSLAEIAAFSGLSRARVQQVAPESELGGVDLEGIPSSSASSG